MRSLRVWLLTAAVLLAGCTHETAGGPHGAQPSNEADRARLAELAQLRAIDVCALYRSAPALAGTPLTVTGPFSPIDCRARIGDPGAHVDASIGLAATTSTPVADQGWLQHVVIDGVDVTVGRPENAPNALPREKMKQWTCAYAANYPGGIRLMADVSAPPAVDNCAMGEELIRAAMQEYAKRPPWGSSAFAPTVVSGKDPCAPIARLRSDYQIDWDIASSGIASCAFALNGAKMSIDLDYADPQVSRFNPDSFEVDGHRVVGDKAQGVFDVVVGPQFQAAGRSQVPVVTVVDLNPNMKRVQAVAKAVVDEFGH